MNGSVISRMLNGDKTAVEILDKIEKKFVPMVVVGELFYGAYKSARNVTALPLSDVSNSRIISALLISFAL